MWGGSMLLWQNIERKINFLEKKKEFFRNYEWVQGI